MMGGGMVAWIVLGIAVVAAAVVAVAWAGRALGGRRADGPGQVRPSDSRGSREALEALRLRYARGEISREEYLQGKVELED
jgi:putative membrane protein